MPPLPPSNCLRISRTKDCFVLYAFASEAKHLRKYYSPISTATTACSTSAFADFALRIHAQYWCISSCFYYKNCQKCQLGLLRQTIGTLSLWSEHSSRVATFDSSATQLVRWWSSGGAPRKKGPRKRRLELRTVNINRIISVWNFTCTDRHLKRQRSQRDHRRSQGPFPQRFRI